MPRNLLEGKTPVYVRYGTNTAYVPLDRSTNRIWRQEVMAVATLSGLTPHSGCAASTASAGLLSAKVRADTFGLNDSFCLARASVCGIQGLDSPLLGVTIDFYLSRGCAVDPGQDFPPFHGLEGGYFELHYFRDKWYFTIRHANSVVSPGPSFTMYYSFIGEVDPGGRGSCFPMTFTNLLTTSGNLGSYDGSGLPKGAVTEWVADPTIAMPGDIIAMASGGAATVSLQDCNCPAPE